MPETNSTAQQTTITPRLHRPTRHWGGTLGITKWEYTHHTHGRTTLFEITHDGVTHTTTVRTYPGAGWTPPSHDFTLHGLTTRQIAARVELLADALAA